MYKLVWVVNPIEILVNAQQAIKIAKWGSKCRNQKTRKRIYKYCIKLIKNSKVNKNAIQLASKS